MKSLRCVVARSLRAAAYKQVEAESESGKGRLAAPEQGLRRWPDPVAALLPREAAYGQAVAENRQGQAEA